MCTAITYKTKDFYVGRTLDYERSYGERVVICPRNYPFTFRETEALPRHYAIIGMAHEADGYPLYYDAVNEKGLGMVGLNFVGNAVYGANKVGKINLAQFELIPYILGKCACVQEAKALWKEIQIRDLAFSDGLGIAQLHWLLADGKDCITVEAVREGLFVYDNPVGVLTNNPPFPVQMEFLNNYRGLSAGTPACTFAQNLHLPAVSRGMGGMGLPGDLSSQSRFVRAAFVGRNSRSGTGERESVNQFFHIAGSVSQPRGCCLLDNGDYEITLYTSCCNASKGIYYYTTYENSSITGVDMRKEDLEGQSVLSYPLYSASAFPIQNARRSQSPEKSE